jgi:hypothetical protein
VIQYANRAIRAHEEGDLGRKKFMEEEKEKIMRRVFLQGLRQGSIRLLTNAQQHDSFQEAVSKAVFHEYTLRGAGYEDEGAEGNIPVNALVPGQSGQQKKSDLAKLDFKALMAEPEATLDSDDDCKKANEMTKPKGKDKGNNRPDRQGAAGGSAQGQKGQGQGYYSPASGEQGGYKGGKKGGFQKGNQQSFQKGTQQSQQQRSWLKCGYCNATTHVMMDCQKYKECLAELVRGVKQQMSEKQASLN